MHAVDVRSLLPNQVYTMYTGPDNPLLQRTRLGSLACSTTHYQEKLDMIWWSLLLEYL